MHHRLPRLTDDDRRLGRFITYARCNDSWRPLRLVYSSGAHEDGPGPNTLTLYLFGWIVRLMLPRLLDDYTERHVAASWDAATVARMGRNWYEERHSREFGFSLSDGFLQVFLGAQTHDSTTTQSWSTHLPWTQWRFHRFSLYDLTGAEFWTQIEQRGHKLRDFDAQREAQARCDKAKFLLRDHDGELITATTHIEEREWRLGEKWCAWLSVFAKPKIRRSLAIEFDKETGTEKGSWKGGTMGTGIDMLPGELHEAAMRRYCEQEHRAKYASYRMEFIGPAVAAVPEPAKRPDLYLVIDLDAKTDDALATMPDELPFQGIAAVMTDAATNGQQWVRNWQAFTDRAAAMEYAAKPGSPTLVVIPLDMDTVPLELTP